MATQDLSALFQSMQGGGQPNPLTQMMGGGGQAPPELTGSPAPQVDPSLQAPSGITNPPQDPLQTQIEALTKQISEGVAQLKQPVDSALPDALKDFDTYNEQRYQQSYGGGGALGTAGRALANLLSGMSHKGQTIKERLTEENRKDWDAAVKSAQMKVQQEKTAQLGAIQQQAQQLQILKAQQQNQQFQAQQGQNQQKIDISAQGTPGNKSAVEQAAIDARVKQMKDAGIWQHLSERQQAAFIAGSKTTTADPQESQAAFPTAKRALEKQIGRELSPDEIIRLNEHITSHPYDLTREQVVLGPNNEYRTVPLTTVKGTQAPIIQGQPSPEGGPPTTGTSGTPQGSPKLGGRDLGFAKPLTPEQSMDNALKLGALDNTISIAKDVKTHLPLLQSLITSKKIQFQIDPNQGTIKALINREVPLTKDEAQLAADFESLTEHINTLRGPLGATGFRGAEAWAALQGQAGNPMANPAVTDKVLERTLAALQTQRDIRGKNVPSTDKPKAKVWNPKTGKFD